MEEAVARWMRHVSGCFRRAPHPFFLFSSPLWYLLSFTLLPLLLRAVAERLPLVSPSPSLFLNLSNYSAYSVQ